MSKSTDKTELRTAKRTLILRQGWDSHDVFIKRQVTDEYEEETLVGRIVVERGRWVIHKPGAVGFERPVEFFSLDEAVTALMKVHT